MSSAESCDINVHTLIDALIAGDTDNAHYLYLAYMQPFFINMR